MDICIETDGSKLRVKNEIFFLESPTNKMEISPFNVKSFIISGKTSLTTCAIQLAIKNNIEIVLVNSYNKPYGRFLNSEFSKTGRLRQAQYKVFNEKSLNIAKVVLESKSKKQLEHVENIVTLEEKTVFLVLLEQLKHCETVEELMGVEGSISKHYYYVLGKNLKGSYKFTKRSFRPANDEFNATLNYIYGILYRKVETALLLAGFDTNTGFLHSNNRKSLSLVFDFIELFRHYGMKFNYSLYKSKLITKIYFEYKNNTVSMSREGKEFLLNNFNNYLEKSEEYQDKKFKRNEIIKLEAHSFSEVILNQF